MKNTPFITHIYSKIRLLSICLILSFSTTVSAQEELESTPPDSLKAVFDIFDRLKSSGNGTLTVNYAPEIKSAVQQHFDKGYSTKLRGWRVRIFRDNGQDGRQRSAGLESSFKSSYPNVPVYRSYQAPYFYVAIGDFRTRDEAEKMKKELKNTYPGASLIQAQINLPPL